MRSSAYLILLVCVGLHACRNAAPEPSNGSSNAGSIEYPATNPWIDRGCELLPEAELLELYPIDPDRDVLNSRTLPGKAYCLRTWMRPNWKQIESDNEKPGAVYREFTNTLATDAIHFGAPVQAQERMALNRSQQRDMYTTDVPDLGEDALWAPSTQTLLVQKGPFLLSVVFHYADTPDENLAEARRVAEQMLRKF